LNFATLVGVERVNKTRFQSFNIIQVHIISFVPLSVKVDHNGPLLNGSVSMKQWDEQKQTSAMGAWQSLATNDLITEKNYCILNVL